MLCEQIHVSRILGLLDIRLDCYVCTIGNMYLSETLCKSCLCLLLLFQLLFTSYLKCSVQQ